MSNGMIFVLAMAGAGMVFGAAAATFGLWLAQLAGGSIPTPKQDR